MTELSSPPLDTQDSSSYNSTVKKEVLIKQNLCITGEDIFQKSFNVN